MPTEIRLAKPKNRNSPLRLLRNSLFESIGATLILLVLLFGYYQISKKNISSYASEYNVLEITGQLLKTELPLDSPLLEKVTVTQITDGDTVKAIRADGTDVIIRYIGIDTPEIKHNGEGTEESYGKSATEMNSWLVLNKPVYLQRDAAELDKYGRNLRYVYLENGVMVNYVLIRLGYANIMTIPPNVAFQQQLFSGQELAKKEGLRLFAPRN